MWFDDTGSCVGIAEKLLSLLHATESVGIWQNAFIPRPRPQMILATVTQMRFFRLSPFRPSSHAFGRLDLCS